MSSSMLRGNTVSPEQVRFARALRRRRTPEENLLWQELRGNRLGVHFRRQHVIGDYIADFYCHRAALALELDGEGHQRHPGYDRMRDQAFAKLGIRTLRFTNRELRHDLCAVLAKIREALT